VIGVGSVDSVFGLFKSGFSGYGHPSVDLYAPGENLVAAYPGNHFALASGTDVYKRQEHLAIAPHGILHVLPFHALQDGERCLADEFTISYTPSGGVLAACLRRPVSAVEGNVVFGIPDARSPAIEREARHVAGLLPDTRLYLGPEASEKRLREVAAEARVLHIATHGFFRRDNPLFSAIRLGDGFLSLFDLYRLNLKADLVTLSGCSTGLSLSLIHI